jgi:hypothetical protein
VRIYAHRGAHFQQRGHVLARLRQILLPLLTQIVVARAFQRRLINDDAAALVLERLQQ